MILGNVFLNYNYVDVALEVNRKYYIKQVKPILSHYNRVHCGVEILPMSKNITNCVFGCQRLYCKSVLSRH